MDKQELQSKIYDLEMQLRMSRDCCSELRAEVATLQSLVPHPGDGSCEHCGASPASGITLCDECRTDTGELGRWQQAIYEEIQKLAPGADIDGGGCDSGDPLDLTLAEIAQGFNYWDNLLFETMESVSHSNIEGSTFRAAAALIKKLAAENEELSQNVCGECSPDNYGWIFNRVEGRAACGCMLEAEPFQILLKALEKIAQDKIGYGHLGYGTPTAVAHFAQKVLHSVLPLDSLESVEPAKEKAMTRDELRKVVGNIESQSVQVNNCSFEMLRWIEDGPESVRELLRDYDLLKASFDANAEETIELRKRFENLWQVKQELENDVIRLRRDVDSRIGEFTQYKERTDTEIQDLKARRFVRFTNEECWIFQGDGTDMLESLVCPVVIRPETLKRIIDMAEPDH